ncbi:methyltransferase [Alkanindiges hydrocarboniclasticus]|jgi:predicted O-methyltransferase YrrM|uniref:Methyltransferase n=1 Tax=Alkanindiges hydrocarboniclasticus TaxID=1907941 RepID=A0A1S8CW57_9GAMM|nr:O-methyltransferase [Alkanindiges hydrocarboniclasticus]ONG41558.1 methyltransferase [Alkanindiges hydrocarboniclasticus]
MSEQLWTAVDDYLEAHFMPADPALEHVLQTTLDAGLPPHLAVSSLQGKFLQMLAQIHGAKKILEIGTLAGYSTIWLARALPQDGRLISLEAVPTNVTLARKNIEFAGLSHLVDIHAGKALDIFPEIEQSGIAPFDFIFIDADKSGYKDYVDWALKLSRPGTVIILDNVIRGGGIVNFDNNTRTMTGLREYFEHLAQQKKLTSTTLQTVGCKGHDGFTLAVVL